MPSTCIVCKKTPSKSGSMYRFPKDPVKRSQWLSALKLTERDVKEHHRVCSCHFRNGDSTQTPSLHLGERFASPKKLQSARGIRATALSTKRRRLMNATCGTKRPISSPSISPSPTPSTLRSMTPATPCSSDDPCLDAAALCTEVGEPLLSDYSVHELHVPCESGDSFLSSSEAPPPPSDVNVTVNVALIAQIEALEVEKKTLTSQLALKKAPFCIEAISHDDALIHFYTGFHTYALLLAFFEFLGPSVNNLQYWRVKSKQRIRKRCTKLNPLNQLFLTLIKLRLALKEKDLAYRFGISTSTVSKYFITWVCFLYCHLREIEWMPTVEQVKACLPHSFKKYCDTYAIIDGTEVFMETPTDLQMQSSTWSNYKHHNTAKFLVGCTPNGAVCFVSPLYVGSISDVELTRVSGFVEKLQGKSGVSVMADRGFTIKDQLDVVGATLNLPPFMEGRKQLSADDVLRGRQIASVRIHVERVIGRIKNYTILKNTLPITMARIANQIVCVCVWLINFQPVLIPPPPDSDCTEDEVQHYFDLYYSTDSDYDADSEDSEDD